MPVSITLHARRFRINAVIRRTTPSILNSVLASIAILAALTAAPAARAQDAMAGSSISPATRFAGGLLSVGGYYFTGSRATQAVGTPKFATDSQLFVRPKQLGGITLTGGVEIISADDHLLPFQGGNSFELIGPAFKVSTPRVVGKIRPFLSGGLFYGRLRSVSQGFDRSNFTPSVSLGVEYPVARYVTLYSSYRVNQQIHGINTDGVSVGVKVF